MSQAAPTIRILGINGSPRKGSTELLLREALWAAQDEGGAAVYSIDLRKQTIHGCCGCGRCHQAGDVAGCRTYRDSMDELVPALVECDGIILATPVYFGGPTSQLKAFMDRTEPLLRYGCEPLRSALRNKIGAGIAVGGNRNGGQEGTLQALLHFFLIHDMMIVGTGPDESPGCYLGAAAFSGPEGSTHEGSTHEGTTDSRHPGVAEDELGRRAARIIGRRVAEAAAIVAASRHGIPDSMTAIDAFSLAPAKKPE